MMRNTVTLSALTPARVREIAAAADAYRRYFDAWRKCRGLIAGLTPDARYELMALMWIGRGDGDAEDFAAFTGDARGLSDSGDVDYICEKTPLAEYLRAGLMKLSTPSLPATHECDE